MTMSDVRNVLPPLDYFVAFEAAAQLGSFAAASRRLNISETAISRKVRLLEQHYNLPLFARGHRSVSLTHRGVELLVKVEGSLGILRKTSREMISQNGTKTVNLAATNSVAALWLMPRLKKFTTKYEHVSIALTASDNDTECLSDGIDLSILRGDGIWPGHKAMRLFGETVFPVCAPSYVASNPGCTSIEALADLDLIEVRNAHVEWMDWKRWFGLRGVSDATVEGKAIFNTYPLAIQAAADGFGVALGWENLVDHLLETRQLVRPLGRISVRTKSGYYLLRSADQKPSPEQEIVEKWLLNVRD